MLQSQRLRLCTTYVISATDKLTYSYFYTILKFLKQTINILTLTCTDLDLSLETFLTFLHTAFTSKDKCICCLLLYYQSCSATASFYLTSIFLHQVSIFLRKYALYISKTDMPLSLSTSNLSSKQAVAPLFLCSLLSRPSISIYT